MRRFEGSGISPVVLEAPICMVMAARKSGFAISFSMASRVCKHAQGHPLTVSSCAIGARRPEAGPGQGCLTSHSSSVSGRVDDASPTGPSGGESSGSWLLVVAMPAQQNNKTQSAPKLNTRPEPCLVGIMFRLCCQAAQGFAFDAHVLVLQMAVTFMQVCTDAHNTHGHAEDVARKAPSGKKTVIWPVCMVLRVGWPKCNSPFACWHPSKDLKKWKRREERLSPDSMFPTST